MCELLVIAHGKIGATVYQDAKLYKRGDVVTVQADGWNWGREELTNSLFRILKLPNVDAATAETLLAWELPVPGSNAPAGPQVSAPDIGNTCQRRKLNLNLDSALIPAPLASYLADDSRAAPSFSSPLAVSGFGALQVTKPVISDPALIGPNPAVIG